MGLGGLVNALTPENKKGSQQMLQPFNFLVPRDRIELPTRGFSVLIHRVKSRLISFKTS